MISSILDLIVSDLPERTVQMTSGCAYGEENALTEIGDGTEVTLVYGRYSANAVVRMRSGGECFHGSFELGAPPGETAAAYRRQAIQTRLRYGTQDDQNRPLAFVGGVRSDRQRYQARR
ncbi:hypothetical protein OMP38_24485 [Cohnella ginsengisoli]|uniref:Uncharacterized protein n=1 Tax=Cohnella ginsengisoli TaxID=425004 RepID=A0A9X4KJY3_9BACL|nr:hypothetical protein [Cohnella ginsengisoli]MDG0793634.1 hypothetical protein [Cohnella ginsengisoli]